MGKDFVLLFAGRNLARFRELAVSCASAGLLNEFLLVDENQQAELFSDGVNIQVPYLKYLAVRVGGSASVTAATIAIGAAADENLRKQRSEFVQDLKQRCADKDIPFRDGTISVPLADGELSPTFIEPNWAFNLVAVPEDWTGESQQIGIPLDVDAAEDIAFNVAVTLTGLWKWSNSPPLSEGVLKEHVAQPPLRLVRATTRVVPLGNVADTIAHAAMDPRSSWPTPDGCEKHPQAEVFVKSALQALVKAKDSEMSLKEAPIPDRPRKERIGILDSIVLYFSHLVANLLGQPAKAWERTKEKALIWAEGYVQRKTFQDESRLTVRYGGRLREEDFAGEGPSRASEIIETPGIDVPAVNATPERWRLLTEVILGAVDGGRTNHEVVVGGYIPTKFRNAIAVADNRSVIAVDPSETAGREFLATVLVNGESHAFTVRSYDVIRYREIHEELARDSKKLKSDEQSKAEDEGQSTTNIEFNQLERDQTKVLLENWHERRSGSLLWSVGEHLDKQIQAAATSLKQALFIVESIPKRIAEADAAQKKKVRRGKWMSRVLIMLLLFAVALPFVPPIASAGILAGGAVAIALFFLPYLALFGVLAGWLANARAQVREAFKLAELENEEEIARKQRQHYWGEIHRLEYCYAHFLDWAEILSTTVWRPFGAVDLAEQPTVVTPTVKALSFQFAKPNFEPDAVLSEQIKMRAHVAGKGWLNNIFEKMCDICSSDYMRLKSVDRGEADPFCDTSLNNEFLQVGDKRLYQPRYQLLEDLRTGKPQQIVAQDKLKEIKEVVSTAELAHLVDYVDAHAFVQIDGAREQREVQDFIAPILEIPSLPVFERFVERGGPNTQLAVGTVYWSASGYLPQMIFNEDKYILHGRCDSEFSSVAIATSRLDVSVERFRPSELTFIRQPTIRPQPADVSQPDGRPVGHGIRPKKID